MKDRRIWTQQEDDTLLEALICSEEDQINWIEVASRLDGRSNKDCRKRWVYSLAPTIKKGPWNESEDSALKEAVLMYGTRWSKVARLVGSRQPDQCSRRWHEVLKPNINRDRWSLLDDEMLKNAVRAHGRRWIEIVERYFPDRTPIATKNRYAQLLQRATEIHPIPPPQYTYPAPDAFLMPMITS